MHVTLVDHADGLGREVLTRLARHRCYFYEILRQFIEIADAIVFEAGAEEALESRDVVVRRGRRRVAEVAM